MKKLGKLSINPERVMKNEELVNLRGGDYYGYDHYPCATQCVTQSGQYDLWTPTCSKDDIASACSRVYGWTGASICVGC